MHASNAYLYSLAEIKQLYASFHKHNELFTYPKSEYFWFSVNDSGLLSSIAFNDSNDIFILDIILSINLFFVFLFKKLNNINFIASL